MAPTVSVLMPVYNAEPYLVRAVNSIVSQSFTDFEFIIIDDGSTDGSTDILRMLERSEPRVRLITRPNRGLVETLNEGLALARGHFVARMDADDIAMPQRLQAQVDYLNRHDECVAIGSRVLLIDSNDWPIREMCTAQVHEEIDAAHLAGAAGAICHPAVTFRATAVCQLGGYRAMFPHVEDLDLFLRLAEIGRIANLSDVLTHYRMHAKSIGHERHHEQLQAIHRATADARRRRGIENTDVGGSVSDPAVHAVSTQASHHRRWGWWALGAGNVRTARKHAREAMRLDPISLDSWRLFYCALRGH